MSPGPLIIPLGPFQIFSKIRGEWMFKCLSEKNFKVNILLRAYLGALYNCRLNFCLFFIFRSRQACIVSTVFSPGSIYRRWHQQYILGILVISDQYQQHRWTILSVVTTEVCSFCKTVNRVARTRMLPWKDRNIFGRLGRTRPPMVTIKRHIHRHLTHPAW